MNEFTRYFHIFYDPRRWVFLRLQKDHDVPFNLNRVHCSRGNIAFSQITVVRIWELVKREIQRVNMNVKPSFFRKRSQCRLFLPEHGSQAAQVDSSSHCCFPTCKYLFPFRSFIEIIEISRLLEEFAEIGTIASQEEDDHEQTDVANWTHTLLFFFDFSLLHLNWQYTAGVLRSFLIN